MFFSQFPTQQNEATIQNSTWGNLGATCGDRSCSLILSSKNIWMKWGSEWVTKNIYLAVDRFWIFSMVQKVPLKI